MVAYVGWRGGAISVRLMMNLNSWKKVWLDGRCERTGPREGRGIRIRICVSILNGIFRGHLGVSWPDLCRTADAIYPRDKKTRLVGNDRPAIEGIVERFARRHATEGPLWSETQDWREVSIVKWRSHRVTKVRLLWWSHVRSTPRRSFRTTI